MRKLLVPRTHNCLTAGVRQGGVLSPFLFAVFIDGIVDKVQSLNVGCYISTMCCCIFLYADDILLLAPSVSGLQILLNACEEELSALDTTLIKENLCVFDLVSALLRNVRNSSLLAVNVSDGLIDVAI